jgi:hypothetical protein
VFDSKRQNGYSFGLSRRWLLGERGARLAGLGWVSAVSLGPDRPSKAREATSRAGASSHKQVTSGGAANGKRSAAAQASVCEQSLDTRKQAKRIAQERWQIVGRNFSADIAPASCRDGIVH